MDMLAKGKDAEEGIPESQQSTLCRELVQDGWFSEKEVHMWPGQRFSLKVKKVLQDYQSEYQHVLVFESETYGRVLVLDGIIQLTERDEFAYQECLAHIPLFVHQDPRKVLIIGGGDGGIAREVARHECVEEVINVEIDEAVPSASRKYFKDNLHIGFEHPKVTLLFEDGNKFLREKAAASNEKFDVVIVDSSDPVGPNLSLFENNFFSLIKNALKPTGVMATQGENMWLHLHMIKQSAERCALLFPTVGYAYACVPTYPSGQIGFMICSMSQNVNLAKMTRPIPVSLRKQLRYYSEDMHRAAFNLPRFVHDELEKFVPASTSASAPPLSSFTSFFTWPLSSILSKDIPASDAVLIFAAGATIATAAAAISRMLIRGSSE